MYQAMLGAYKSIYWELYMFVDDDAGVDFFDLLEQKAKSGVDVKLIIDALGSFGLSKKRITSLKQAGVDVRLFKETKKKIRSWWKRMCTRTHRKILVVDEDIGFIGGVNIQKNMLNWMDIQVRIEGNAVHSLLRSFAKLYILCGGDKANVKHLLKFTFRVQSDEKDLEFIYDDGNSTQSKARRVYTEALLKARERVILFSPYYFPDKKFLHALWKARKRGVHVDMLIPFRSDLRVAQYAAYAYFSVLHKLGVHLHLSDSMMHGKGVVVDDDWAMIGSSNLDNTSFYDNYEANVKLREKHIVGEIKKTVVGWITKAKRLDIQRWEKRGYRQRFKEILATTFYKIWHGRK